MMSESLLRVLSTWAAAWSDHALAVLWQSALVFALVWPAARLARRQGPVLRRALWALVLLRLVLPADFALPVGIGNLAKPILTDRASAAQMHRAVSAPTRDRLPLAAAPLPWSAAPTWTAADTDTPAPAALAAAPAVPRSSFSFELAAFAVWLAGVLALAVLLLRRHRAIRASVRNAQPVAAGPLRDMFLACCRRIPSPTLFRPTLSISRDLTSPMLVGIWRPRVILPQRLLGACSREELEALVLHELAHVRQWDLLINCAQLALQVAHWYNPLVWLTNRELRRERELACDDRVLLATGLRRREYAAGLLKVLELTPPRLAWSLGALSVAESKTTFRWRIKRIMDGKLKPSPRLTILSLAALLVFGAVVLAAAPYQASSEAPRPEPEQAAAPAGEQQTTAKPDPRPSLAPREPASDPERAAELERIRSELEAEQRELEGATARLDTARSDLLAKQEILRAKAEELGRIRTEALAERQRAIGKSTAELNRARSELLAAYRQLREAAAEVHRLQREMLAEHRREVQEALREVARARSELLRERLRERWEQSLPALPEWRPELDSDGSPQIPWQFDEDSLLERRRIRVPFDLWLPEDDSLLERRHIRVPFDLWLPEADQRPAEWPAYFKMLEEFLPDDTTVHGLPLPGELFGMSMPDSDLNAAVEWYLNMLPPGEPFPQEEWLRVLEELDANLDLTAPALPDRAPLHPKPNAPPSTQP